MKRSAGGKECSSVLVLCTQSLSRCCVRGREPLRSQHLSPARPPTFKMGSLCTPSALEDLINVFAAILMRGLKILQLLPQILDVRFKFCGFGG